MNKTLKKVVLAISPPRPGVTRGLRPYFCRISLVGSSYRHYPLCQNFTQLLSFLEYKRTGQKLVFKYIQHQFEEKHIK